MISKFNQFINEGVRDLMLPKSKEEIKEILKNTSPDELLQISISKLRDINLVKEAIEKGANPSRNNNVFLKSITLDWHYDNNIVDYLDGDLTKKDQYLVDDWFVGHCLDDSKETQEEVIDFYKEVLKIFLKDKRVYSKLTAIEILGYRSLLKLN